MVQSTLVDLTKLQILSVGTGILQLGAAVPGFRGQEALTDGAPYSYSIQQGSNYELGQGTYNLAAATLTRGVIVSSAGGGPIALTPNAILTFTVFAVDLRVPGPPGNPGAPGGPGNPGTPGTAGTVIYSDVVDPVAGVGAPGDFFINTTSSVFFGPKGATTWPGTGISIKGDYSIAFSATSSILANELLLDHAVARACTLQANLASSQVSVGTPPAATWAADVQKNGTSIGTISISAAGAVTLTTVGGTAKPLAVGDVVSVIAPAVADATIARLRGTLRGI